MPNSWGLPDTSVTTLEESQAYFNTIRDYNIVVKEQANSSGPLPSVYVVQVPIQWGPTYGFPFNEFVLGFDNVTNKWVQPYIQTVKDAPTPDEVFAYLKEPHTVEEIYKFLGF